MKNRDRLMSYLFIVAGLLALALEVLPGRFATTDEEFFKSAGRHWAATGHFAAPEIVGRIDVQPSLEVIYFAQPPLYSFAFGLFTKTFGFGPYQSILFDALIHLLLAFATVVLAHRVFELPARYAYLIGLLILPIGQRGRPDELAMSIAIAGIVAWTLDLKPAYRALLSGVAFGICGATSIGACLFLAPLALLVGYQRRVLTLRNGAGAIVVGAVAGLLCVSPILLPHPDAVHQLLAHAVDQSPEMGRVSATEHSRWANIRQSYREGVMAVLQFGMQAVDTVACAILLLILCWRAMPKERARAWKQSALLAVSIMFLISALLPGKYTYLWFFAPWLVSLAAIVLMRSYGGLRAATRTLAALLIAGSIAFAWGLYAKDRLEILTLAKDQSFYWNMKHVRDTIPAGSRVVTKEYWAALADKCQVLDPDFSHPKPVDVDYLIKTGNGTGVPGKPQTFSPEYEAFAAKDHFVVEEDDLNRTPLKIVGIRISKSAYGFGPYIEAHSPVAAPKPNPAP